MEDNKRINHQDEIGNKSFNEAKENDFNNSRNDENNEKQKNEDLKNHINNKIKAVKYDNNNKDKTDIKLKNHEGIEVKNNSETELFKKENDLQNFNDEKETVLSNKDYISEDTNNYQKLSNENIIRNKENLLNGNKSVEGKNNLNLENSVKTNEKAKVDINIKKTFDENKTEDVKGNLRLEIDKTKNSPKEVDSTAVKTKVKPVKEVPIEKKPFSEFVNDYLIPEIKNQFKLKGKEVNKINLKKTNRPIAEDICWVIYCEVNNTCNFWLSFEKDDITSLKSFSLCKNYEKPSIIESFLIDEKKITLKLIISRILQRLNGQKLIGAN